MENIGLSSYRLSGKTLDKPLQLGKIVPTIPSAQRGVISIESVGSLKYFVDGVEIDWWDWTYEYSLLPAFMFESVEILREEDSFARFGFRASNGAIVMETKKYRGSNIISDASIEIYRPEGYCILKEFYIPAYDYPEIRQRTTPDLRTTIYWNPVVRTNASGEAEVSFYTADFTASYSYVLEGIGDNKIVF